MRGVLAVLGMLVGLACAQGRQNEDEALTKQILAGMVADDTEIESIQDAWAQLAKDSPYHAIASQGLGYQWMKRHEVESAWQLYGTMPAGDESMDSMQAAAECARLVLLVEAKKNETFAERWRMVVKRVLSEEGADPAARKYLCEFLGGMVAYLEHLGEASPVEAERLGNAKERLEAIVPKSLARTYLDRRSMVASQLRSMQELHARALLLDGAGREGLFKSMTKESERVELAWEGKKETQRDLKERGKENEQLERRLRAHLADLQAEAGRPTPGHPSKPKMPNEPRRPQKKSKFNPRTGKREDDDAANRAEEREYRQKMEVYQKEMREYRKDLQEYPEKLERWKELDTKRREELEQATKACQEQIDQAEIMGRQLKRELAAGEEELRDLLVAHHAGQDKAEQVQRLREWFARESGTELFPFPTYLSLLQMKYEYERLAGELRRRMNNPK